MRPPALPFLSALLALAAGCTPSAAPGTFLLSGNLEVADAQLSFKHPGRIAARLVTEGETVTAGQLLARLDDSEQRQEVALRRAELAAAAAVVAELEAGSRPEEIAAARAVLRSAEAERDRARLELRRERDLLARQAIATREFEAAEAQLQVAEARAVEAAERGQLITAGPRPEAVLQARARRDQAAAALALAEVRLDQTRLLAPLAGTVLSHHAEPGEYVAAGTPVATVADTTRTWVRAYLNQTDLGRVRLGQEVRVRIDTFPDRPYAGVVSFIASEAEFTPKAVQTAKERVRLVFRIKVDVANPRGELKPGMPADVLLGP